MMEWLLRVVAITVVFSAIALLAAPKPSFVKGSIGAVDLTLCTVCAASAETV